MSVLASDWIAHHAHFSPNKMAAVDVSSGRRFTYADVDDRVSRAALYLKSLGISEGDRVAVLCHNDTDVFEVQFACQRLGAIFLPLNWRLAIPELEFICNDATPKLLLYGTEFAVEAAEVAKLAS
ncbi:MAG: AMP-binding protein, partial [Minwuiales bacterium]|nr:AMP-binding protein [Minwuiales bacterium]